VQNCNDAPWWTSLRNPIDPKKFPSYFEPGRTLGLRTQMSLSILEGQEKFSLDDIKRLKFSTNMLLADRVKPDLVRALKAVEKPSEEIRSGLKVMEDWDNHVSAESRGGVLFERFWQQYTNTIGRVRVAFRKRPGHLCRGSQGQGQRRQRRSGSGIREHAEGPRDRACRPCGSELCDRHREMR
jgi:hypothetical protein